MKADKKLIVTSTKAMSPPLGNLLTDNFHSIATPITLASHLRYHGHPRNYAGQWRKVDSIPKAVKQLMFDAWNNQQWIYDQLEN